MLVHNSFMKKKTSESIKKMKKALSIINKK